MYTKPHDKVRPCGEACNYQDLLAALDRAADVVVRIKSDADNYCSRIIQNAGTFCSIVD